MILIEGNIIFHNSLSHGTIPPILLSTKNKCFFIEIMNETRGFVLTVEINFSCKRVEGTFSLFQYLIRRQYVVTKETLKLYQINQPVTKPEF